MIEDIVFQNGLEKNIMYLTKLEEECEKLINHSVEHQKHIKIFFDKKYKSRKFMPFKGNMPIGLGLWEG